ncbi:MAG: VOC family protein [Pseudohongiellaceae bacterium]
MNDTTESNGQQGADADEASTTSEAAQQKPVIGHIEWLDLTVDDASRVRDFYTAVVGWKSDDVPMGSYADFSMSSPESGTTVAGVCHARGSNANLPSQWLVYVRVASVADSAAECEKKGGKVLDGPRRMGGANFAVIQDPAGAVLALLSD